jgi:site-specific DNA recombinase
VRVSKVGGREGEGFISPTEQENAIREWCSRAGVEVLVQPHELDVSGGTMDRPVFNRIMDRVRRGESGGIVVYKTDRFARTLLGAVTTLAELGEHRAAFASATEPELDYSTPSGRAFLHMLFVFSEFTRSSLKESWAAAQRSAIDRGIQITPTVPFGFDRGSDGRLVPNGDAHAVAELFKRRGAGDSWGALAEWLNDAAPKADGTVWVGQTVQRLCSKRVYRGEASRYVSQDVDGRGPVVNGDAHPALVTEADWQAAQMNPRLAKPRDGKSLPLLSGLVRCGGCRYSMSLGRGPNGERLYRCRAKHASGKCPSPASILAGIVEPHVEDAVIAEIDGIVKFVPDSADRDHAVKAAKRARDDLDDFRRDTAARRKLGGAWNEWLDTYLRAVKEADADLDRLNLATGPAMQGLTREHYLPSPPTTAEKCSGGSWTPSWSSVPVAAGGTPTRSTGASGFCGAARVPPTFPADGSSTRSGRLSSRTTSKPGLWRRRTARRTSRPERRAASGAFTRPA